MVIYFLNYTMHATNSTISAVFCNGSILSDFIHILTTHITGAGCYANLKNMGK